MQELLSALQTDPIWVDFTYENRDDEDAISLIKSMWDMCHPQKSIWPEKELNGKERTYYASTEHPLTPDPEKATPKDTQGALEVY